VWAIDPPFNTFPSLHVSLATLAALVVWQHDPRLGRWMALGATVLTLSTFLVKQHFIRRRRAATVPNTTGRGCRSSS